MRGGWIWLVLMGVLCLPTPALQQHLLVWAQHCFADHHHHASGPHAHEADHPHTTHHETVPSETIRLPVDVAGTNKSSAEDAVAARDHEHTQSGRDVSLGRGREASGAPTLCLFARWPSVLIGAIGMDDPRGRRVPTFIAPVDDRPRLALRGIVMLT